MPKPRANHRHTERVWVCLGVTDDMHPWCPFETTSRTEARQHGEHEGHYCVADDDPKVEA